MGKEIQKRFYVKINTFLPSKLGEKKKCVIQ